MEQPSGTVSRRCWKTPTSRLAMSCRMCLGLRVKQCWEALLENKQTAAEIAELGHWRGQRACRRYVPSVAIYYFLYLGDCGILLQYALRPSRQSQSRGAPEMFNCYRWRRLR